MASDKNILFDLGGVILDVDLEETIKEFKHLGADADALFSKHKDLIERFGRGDFNSSVDEFRRQLKVRLNIPECSNEQFDYAWNKSLQDIPENRIAFLKDLKEDKGFNLFLFSNTNPIHYAAILKLLKRTFNVKSFDEWFKGVEMSHLLHFRKPDPETYKKLAACFNIEASETIVIDDDKRNLQGAINAGFQRTVLLNGKMIDSYQLDSLDEAIKATFPHRALQF